MSAPASSLVVRTPAGSDFEQWLPLWTGYNTFYKRTLPDAVTRSTWARRRPAFCFFVNSISVGGSHKWCHIYFR